VIIGKINEKAQAELAEVRKKIAADTDAVKAKLIRGSRWIRRYYQ
jgi:hypothetical protein